MRLHPSLATLLIALAAIAPGLAQMRTFADDQGNTTQAELTGVVGKDVVLRKNGVTVRYALAGLSTEDQAFVKNWQVNPPATPHQQVQLWARQGFSPAGTFSENQNTPPSLPNIPGVVEIKKRETFHYYDVSVSNPGSVQANRLSLAYQLYVITASGNVVVETGTESLPGIDPRTTVSVATKAISSTRTKTTSLSLSGGTSSGVSIGEKSKRSAERFGGGWARVYAQDGSLVGESRQLIPELEQTKPAWVGPTGADGAKIKSLDQFDPLIAQVKERLEALRKLLDSLPPLPQPPGDGNPPPLPPGMPKPPGS
ncbi:MAG: hypothetical protein ACREKL_03015 [Chthoniobacterales bacterium]